MPAISSFSPCPPAIFRNVCTSRRKSSALSVFLVACALMLALALLPRAVAETERSGPDVALEFVLTEESEQEMAAGGGVVNGVLVIPVPSETERIPADEMPEGLYGAISLPKTTADIVPWLRLGEEEISLFNTDSFTMEAMLRKQWGESETGGHSIFMIRNFEEDEAGVGGVLTFRITIQQDGLVNLVLSYTNAASKGESQEVRVTSASILPENDKWYHAAVSLSWDEAIGLSEVTFFWTEHVEGEPIKPAILSGEYDLPRVYPIKPSKDVVAYIGGSSSTANMNLGGDLAFFRYANKALQEEEMTVPPLPLARP